MDSKPKPGSKAWKCVDDDSGIVVIAAHGEEDIGKAELALRTADEAFEKHKYVGVFLTGSAVGLARKGNKNKAINELVKRLIEKDAELMAGSVYLEKHGIKEEKLIEQIIPASLEEVLEISKRKTIIAI